MKTTEITEILNRKRGDQITYHIGFLCDDAEKSGGKHSGAKALNQYEREAIADMRKIAHKLYNEGICTFVQRKVAPFQYEYIAQRL